MQKTGKPQEIGNHVLVVFSGRSFGQAHADCFGEECSDLGSILAMASNLLAMVSKPIATIPKANKIILKFTKTTFLY